MLGYLASIKIRCLQPRRVHFGNLEVRESAQLVDDLITI